MAKIQGQQIPPSLAGDLARLVYSRTGASGGLRTAALTPGARAARASAASAPLLALAGAAARWLAVAWSPPDAAAFYAARRSELLRGVFDPAYWHSATLLLDRTEHGTPAVGPYGKPVPPAYYDPLRQPTACLYSTWSQTYPTPAGPGTAGQPAPGWKGAVSGVAFRDLWLAQRRLRYRLPVAVERHDGRPVVLRIDGRISATATVRGNRAWFAFGVWPFFWSAARDSATPANALAVHWRREDIPPLALAGDRPGGWAADVAVLTLRDARQGNPFGHRSGCDRLDLVVATPPAWGTYFARNDAVAVAHRETVGVYLGKGPHG